MFIVDFEITDFCFVSDITGFKGWRLGRGEGGKINKKGEKNSIKLIKRTTKHKIKEGEGRESWEKKKRERWEKN